jgi:hypothetical protein
MLVHLTPYILISLSLVKKYNGHKNACFIFLYKFCYELYVIQINN